MLKFNSRICVLLRLLLVTTLAVVSSVTISAREHFRAGPGPSASVIGAAAGDRSWSGLIDPHVFSLALGAAACAIQAGVVANPSTLTVIDYSKPSTAERLWVFDMRTRELLYQELVAHGQGSGANFATSFSNDPQTHRSSLGLFVTEETYVGKNGYSLRLSGLDSGFNDHARERAIVMHGAAYVSREFARIQGRLGRSWGCPALPDGIARTVIDRIKGGSLLFAYYPDQRWLTSSKYLGCTPRSQGAPWPSGRS